MLTAPRRTFLLAIASSVSITQSLIAGPPIYTIRDLGTLGGAGSAAYGINDAGVVVGEADLPSGDRTGFLWLADPRHGLSAGMHDVGVLVDRRGTALAVGPSAAVTGWAGPAARSDARGYIAFPGTSPVPLASSAAAAPVVAGMAMNSWEDVAGWEVYNGRLRAVVSSDTVASVLLSPTGSRGTWALGINDGLHVAGGFATLDSPAEAVVWYNGSPSPLGTLGGRVSEARAINNDDLVVGYSRDVNERVRAFSWRTGQMSNLGTLGGNESAALAVNADGVIVGYSRLGRMPVGSPLPSFALRACVWIDSMPADLNTRIVNGGGWELFQAYGINSAGQIVGRGRNPAGQIRAFILTPVGCAGDADSNGRIDSSDLTEMLRRWFESLAAGGSLGDYNGDGVINSSDVSAFLRDWMQTVANGCPHSSDPGR